MKISLDSRTIPGAVLSDGTVVPAELAGKHLMVEVRL